MAEDIEMLSALAEDPSAGAEPVEGPSSPSMAPSDQENESNAESSALAQLAGAFKVASDPREAALILVEFLETAGFKREN